MNKVLRQAVRLPTGVVVPIGTLLAVGLLLVGLGIRIWWSLAREGSGATGEAFNVARAVAEGRGFADAYQIGQGPTAHLMPISPGIAGGVYRLLGVNSSAAECVLTSWALALMLGTYVLVYRLFAQLNVSYPARLGALAYLCIAPVYIAQEAVDFRIWEGGLAVFLSAAFLSVLLAADRNGGSSYRCLAGLAGLAALLFFVNPILGIGGYACALLFAVRRLAMRQFVFAGLMAATALAALEVPWIIRNATVMGAFVPLRSNAGLELALGQNPSALSNYEHAKVYQDRLEEIHPAVSTKAYEHLKKVGGEVAYANMLGRATQSWMKEYPAAAIALSLRHLRQTFALEAWQFGTGLLPGMRAALASASGVAGLVGLILALSNRRPRWLYIGILVGVPAIAMAPFQPISRYTYLFYPWLTFCAAYLIDALVGRTRLIAERSAPTRSCT